MLRGCVLYLAAVLLAACATVEPDLPWPEGAAPREHFLRHYRDDGVNQQAQSEEQYLYWVRRFYGGSSLMPGWLAITRQVQKAVDAGDRERTVSELVLLGEKIGSEWAKDNGVRLINTRNTAVWGQAVLEAMNREDLGQFLPRLQQDVHAILSRQLGSKDITFERYYRWEPDPF